MAVSPTPKGLKTKLQLNICQLQQHGYNSILQVATRPLGLGADRIQLVVGSWRLKTGRPAVLRPGSWLLLLLPLAIYTRPVGGPGPCPPFLPHHVSWPSRRLTPFGQLARLLFLCTCESPSKRVREMWRKDLRTGCFIFRLFLEYKAYRNVES